MAWEEPLLGVLLFICGSDVDHHISSDTYELFVHCQSFASVVTSFKAFPKEAVSVRSSG